MQASTSGKMCGGAVWSAILKRAAKALALSALCLGLAAACATRGSVGGSNAQSPSAPTVGATSPALEALGPPEPGLGAPIRPDGLVTFALLAPKSHPEQTVRTIAASMENAARLAIEGLGDPRLQLRIYDTAGDAEAAAAAARQAAADGASMLIGPLFSSSVAAVEPVADELGLTAIAFSSDASVASDNMFLISYLARNDIDRIVSYAASQGVQTMGLLAPNTPLGDVAVAATQEVALRAGVIVGPIVRYERNFESIEQATKLYAEAHLGRPVGPDAPEPSESELAGDPPGPDAVLIADQGDGLRTVGAFLAYFDVSSRDVRYVGLSGWNDPGIRSETALRRSWFPAADPLVTDAFAARYEARFGAPPHELAALAHDAVAAAAVLALDARVVSDPHPFTPEKIANPTGFRGVTGVFRFRPDGLNERGLAVFEIDADGFLEIDPAPTAFAAL